MILERAREVGGTWRENSYPGCRCDVPSHVYSFSFAPNPDWSESFSPQAEIFEYLRRVADQEGLTGHVRFGCELERAEWDADARVWKLRTSSGELSARVLIAGAGPLHEPKLPRYSRPPRLRRHPLSLATWDHDHELAGERVAVIGTGASAIQFVPQIQPDVEKLHLFQRTAPWVMPRRQRRITRVERAVFRRFPGRPARDAFRDLLGPRGARDPDAARDPGARAEAVGLAHLKRSVADPALRAKLTPD